VGFGSEVVQAVLEHHRVKDGIAERQRCVRRNHPKVGGREALATSTDLVIEQSDARRLKPVPTQVVDERTEATAEGEDVCDDDPPRDPAVELLVDLSGEPVETLDAVGVVVLVVRVGGPFDRRSIPDQHGRSCSVSAPLAMKILVTGAAGFIGSNLTAELLRRGHAVVGVDNLSQGSLLNLSDVVSHTSFDFREVDIRDERAMLAAADDCDVIVHLAAYKIPRYGDAYETLMINGFGSEIVAQTAAKTKTKIVAASTSDVYGKNPHVPFSETMDSVIGNPHVRRWAYAISKMFEEQLLLACHERFGIDVVILRFFGGYGPNQNLTWWGGPQSVFIERALDGETLPIHGDGRQTRSFTYVSDHVDGIVAAVETPNADNLVINIGAVEEITILGLAELIWRLINGPGSLPRIELIPYESFGRYEDVPRRVPDITRARELLGFEPKVDLETGLRETIEWQTKRRRAAPA
jgi:UDP-glucose 4-epimerase